jgi:hypothetical protein
MDASPLFRMRILPVVNQECKKTVQLFDAVNKKHAAEMKKRGFASSNQGLLMKTANAVIKFIDFAEDRYSKFKFKQYTTDIIENGYTGFSDLKVVKILERSHGMTTFEFIERNPTPFLDTMTRKYGVDSKIVFEMLKKAKFNAFEVENALDSDFVSEMNALSDSKKVNMDPNNSKDSSTDGEPESNKNTKTEQQ